MNPKNVILSPVEPGVTEYIQASQGENNARVFSFTVLDSLGQPLDMAGCTVAFYVDRLSKGVVQVAASVSGSVATVTLPSGSCNVPGEWGCWLQIIKPDEYDLRVDNLKLRVQPCNIDEAAEASDEFSLLTQLIVSAQEAIDNANSAATAANSAAGSANSAANEANTAAGAANTAAGSANSAAQSANSSAELAGQKAGEADNAAAAANTAASSATTAAQQARELIEELGQLDVSQMQTDLNSHIANQNNPHGVTASQTGALPTAGGSMSGAIQFEGGGSIQSADSLLKLSNGGNILAVGPDGVTSNGKTIPAVESVSWTPRAELGNGTPVDKTQSKGTAYKIGNLVLISLSITFAGPYSGDQALYLTDLPYNLKYGTYPYGDYFNKLVTNRFMGCVYSSGDGYIMIRRMEAAADNSIKNNYGNDVMYQTIYEGNFIAEIA